MTDFIISAAAGFALVSFCFSLGAIVVTWQKRSEHPAVAPLRSELDAVRLSVADLIDRVEHWQRRDRTRKARADAAQDIENSLPELAPGDVKAQLRAVARAKGVVR